MHKTIYTIYTKQHNKHKTMTINKATIITKILLQEQKHTQYNNDTKHNTTVNN